MKKMIKLFVIAFILYGNSQLLAQKQFCWEVSGGKGKVYILGSIHAGNESMYPFIDEIENAFSSSEVLAVEVDISSINAMAMAQKMMLMDGSKLQDHVADSTYTMLKSKFEEFGMEEMHFSMLKPWAAAMALTQLEVQKSDMELTQGIDLYFIGKAKNSNKEILSLEDAEMQLDIFESLATDADDFIHYTLNYGNQSINQLEDMVKFLQNGDLDGLDKFINKSFDEMKSSKKFKDALLDNRNIAMAQKIKQMALDGKNAFVVVGAGHFTGEKGLVNLLSKDFKLRQLSK